MKNALLSLVILAALPIQAAAQEAWQRKANLPRGRWFHGGATIGTRLYIYGGTTTTGGYDGSCDEYDPLTDAWRSRAAMPAAVYGMGATSLGGYAYSVAGYLGGTSFNSGSPITTVYRYDPALDTWVGRAAVSSARYWNLLLATSSRLYTIGGNIGGSYIATVEEYDPGTDTWTPRTDYPVNVCTAFGGLINGRLYVGGGFSLAWNPALYAYDPSANSWGTALAPFGLQRAQPVGLVIANKLYAMTGQYGGGLNENNEYDPATNQWTGRMRTISAQDWAVGGVVNSRGYILGGAGDSTCNQQYHPIQVGELPDAPTGLFQRKVGGAPVAPGTWVGSNAMEFGATLSDPDVADNVYIEVEVQHDAPLFMGDVSTASPAGPQGVHAAVYSGLVTGDWVWRCRAADTNGNVSSWVEFGNAPDFRIDVDPPSVPTLISPANTYTTFNETVGFDWSDSTDAMGVASYDIQFARDAGFGRVEATVTTTTSAYAGPLSVGLHHWRVRATDVNGYTSNWSVSRIVVRDDQVDHAAGDAAKVCGFSASGIVSTPVALLLVAIAILLNVRRK